MYSDADRATLKLVVEHRRVATKAFRMVTERALAFLAYLDDMRDRLKDIELRELVPKEYHLYFGYNYDFDEDGSGISETSTRIGVYEPETLIDGYEWSARCQAVWDASTEALWTLGSEVGFHAELNARALWMRKPNTRELWRQMLPVLTREAEFHNFLRQEIHARSKFHIYDKTPPYARIVSEETTRYNDLVMQQAFWTEVAGGRVTENGQGIEPEVPEVTGPDAYGRYGIACGWGDWFPTEHLNPLPSWTQPTTTST